MVIWEVQGVSMQKGPEKRFFFKDSNSFSRTV